MPFGLLDSFAKLLGFLTPHNLQPNFEIEMKKTMNLEIKANIVGNKVVYLCYDYDRLSTRPVEHFYVFEDAVNWAKKEKEKKIRLWAELVEAQEKLRELDL
jgi:hypothetical protein